MKQTLLLINLFCLLVLCPQLTKGQTAEEYLQLAQEKLEAKEYFRALDYLNESIQKKPKYAEAYFLKGLAEFNLQNTMGAIENFNLAVEYNPDYLEAYFNRGLIYAGLQKHQEAADDFSKILEKKAIPVVFEQRGVANYNLKKAEQAKLDFQGALRLNPKLFKSFYYLGMLAFDEENLEQSVKYLSQAVTIKPDYEDAYTFRVKVFLQKGDSLAALTDYEHLIQLNPYNYEAFSNRGKINYALEHYQEALPDFTRLVTKQPENAEAFYYRARIYQQLKKYEEACLDWQEAKRLGYSLNTSEVEDFCLD